MTAWRRVAAGMDRRRHHRPARHAQGPAAWFRGGGGMGIPLNLAQRWMGHTQLSTTAIYAEAVGEEERSIASRMW